MPAHNPLHQHSLPALVVQAQAPLHCTKPPSLPLRAAQVSFKVGQLLQIYKSDKSGKGATTSLKSSGAQNLSLPMTASPRGAPCRGVPRHARLEVSPFFLSFFSGKALEGYLRKHPIPVIDGPGGQLYMTDHHHMACALLKLEGLKLQLRDDIANMVPQASLVL